jgi:hypothetical protein
VGNGYYYDSAASVLSCGFMMPIDEVLRLKRSIIVPPMARDSQICRGSAMSRSRTSAIKKNLDSGGAGRDGPEVIGSTRGPAKN